MAVFTSSSSSSEYPALLPASASLSGAPDDTFEDGCSICFEPFSSSDPASITSCKHEYHLHCILEWSQRSKECPICCQLLELKDPASQEDLAAAGRGKRSRSGNNFHLHEDHIRRVNNLEAGLSRAHYNNIRERQRYYGLEPSQVLVLASPEEMTQQTSMASPVHQNLIYGSSGRSLPPSGLPSDIHVQTSFSMETTDASDVNAGSAIGTESEIPSNARDDSSTKASDSSRRTNPSEMFSLPDSLKSKLAATSARYKESISRSTLGIKEKLLARNNSVKELSREVHREMNASIAGFARMIERLDLSSKANAASFSSGGSTLSFFKGKNVQENVISEALMKSSGDNIHELTSEAPSSYVSCAIPDPVEVTCTKERN